jgi:hypothetical protein
MDRMARILTEAWWRVRVLMAMIFVEKVDRPLTNMMEVPISQNEEG